MRYREPRGNIRVSRNQHLVTRADAISAQYELERLQTVTDADAMLGPAILCELPLESVQLGAEDIVARFDHSVERRFQLLCNLGVLCAQVKERKIQLVPLAARNSA